jgi:hypothetical protein
LARCLDRGVGGLQRPALLSGEVAADFAQVYEVFMGAAASDYQLYLDDIAFW